jgi:hypothetical protein
MYVDNVDVFIHPNEQELHVIDCILQIFSQAGGLMTNMAKTQCYPIRCEQVNLHFLNMAGRFASNFPCTYLGLPLSFRKPPKLAIQPYV